MIVTAEQVVRALTGAPDGVASSDWLMRVLRCAADDLAGPLAALADTGKALVWPAAAGVLGVVLTATTRPKWSPKLRWKKEGATLTNFTFPDRPDPRSVVITDRDPCGVPYPGYVPIGERLIWGGPDWVEERKPCRGCGGRRVPISVDSYCQLCDRAGRSAATWGVRAESEAPVRIRPHDDGLAGGRGEETAADPEEGAKLLAAAERDLRERYRKGGRRKRSA